MIHGKRASLVVALVWGAALLTSCSMPTSSNTSPPAGTATPSEATASPDFVGLVGIGGGREIYVECSGTGSPTVLLISGTRGAADEWSTLLPDAGGEAISVFDALAKTTRVCAYDRPGTAAESGELTASTVVAQPTTAVQGAEDLHALAVAIDEPDPYVVVGLSWGGMIAQQFVRTYPEEVGGLVLLDSASAFLQETLTAEQWSAWMAVVANSVDAVGSEAPDYENGIATLNDTHAPPGVPVVVMSSDHPWDLQVTPTASTWPGWVAAQARLAESLSATHITDTNSGHGLPVEQPVLVADGILRVVDAVRAGSRPSS